MQTAQARLDRPAAGFRLGTLDASSVGMTARLCTFLLFAATTSACGPATQAEAQAAADRWANARTDGWTLTVDEQRAAQAFQFAAYSHACPSSSTADFSSIVYTAPGYDVTLDFDCVAARPTDLAALRETFAFAVLNRLPHGLDVEGWKFWVLTPASSFTEGVEIAALGGGRLMVRINTQLYAIVGAKSDPACAVQDAPAPEGCSVHRDLGIPLALTLTAPFTLQLFPSGG
jgi:hypothetical protein